MTNFKHREDRGGDVAAPWGGAVEGEKQEEHRLLPFSRLRQEARGCSLSKHHAQAKVTYSESG
jgi:hypothetical protein